MLLPKHEELVKHLIERCQASPNVTQWWGIGAEMHTITDDYKLFFDYPAAKPELDAMWDEWKKAEPKEIRADDTQ